MTEKNKLSRRLVCNALGIFFSVIPVTVSIFSYFPIWIKRGDASVLSGLSLLLLGLAVIPLYKYLKDALRSASAPVMWLILFITFFLLSKIADEMTVISFVGLVGNIAGSLFFRRARVSDNE